MPYILGVGASPRPGGNTDVLLKQALDAASEAGARVDMIHLRKMKMSPCIGCEACREVADCPTLKDDMTGIYPKIREADGLVLASPCHNYNITAWMKAFIDRLYCFYDFSDDRPRGYKSRLADKARWGAVIAVCEQVDPKDMGFTLEAMAQPMEALAFRESGRLGVYGVFDAGLVGKDAAVMEKAAGLGRALVAKF